MLLQYCPELQGPSNSQRCQMQAVSAETGNQMALSSAEAQILPSHRVPLPFSFLNHFSSRVTLLRPSLFFSSLLPLLSLVTLTGILSPLPVFDNSNDFISQSKLSLVEISVSAHLYRQHRCYLCSHTYFRIGGLTTWGVIWYTTVGVFHAVRLVCGHSTRDIPSI